MYFSNSKSLLVYTNYILLLLIIIFFNTKVESLTLPHEDGSFETACNLLNSKMTGPSQVLEKAQVKARELELEIVRDNISQVIQYYSII